MTKFLALVSTLLAAAPAMAFNTGGTVPTPGTLSLVGLAAAIGIAVALRKKK